MYEQKHSMLGKINFGRRANVMHFTTSIGTYDSLSRSWAVRMSLRDIKFWSISVTAPVRAMGVPMGYMIYRPRCRFQTTSVICFNIQVNGNAHIHRTQIRFVIETWNDGNGLAWNSLRLKVTESMWLIHTIYVITAKYRIRWFISFNWRTITVFSQSK